MKKLWIAPVFALLAAASSFASDLESVNIHIEGTATLEEHWDFFMNNFAIEAAGAGYTVVEDKDEAEYTLQFQAEPYEEENPGEFSVQITVVRNEDGAEVLCFDYYFTSLDEINELNQFLFFQATISIPRPKEVEVETVTETVYETVFETVVEEKLVPVPESDDWRNKWLYARVSADYPITFYKLKGDGLIGGVAVYEGPYDSPTRVSPLDNSIVAMPGVTVGAELQFLNWMSVEPFFQLTLGRPGFYMFPNFALGAELKFPVKLLRTLMIEPYGAFSMMLNKSPVYDQFPRFSCGGGVQAGFKGGSRGAFFADVNFMYNLGDAVMYNTYDPLYPDPKVIHYGRFMLGLGIGYKIGFFNRK